MKLNIKSRQSQVGLFSAINIKSFYIKLFNCCLIFQNKRSTYTTDNTAFIPMSTVHYVKVENNKEFDHEDLSLIVSDLVFSDCFSLA